MGWLLLVWLLHTPAHATAFTARKAQVLLQPDGRPSQVVAVELPHRWDKTFPGLGGQARYELTLPAVANIEPHGLYFPRMGNQVEVLLNGRLLAHLGTLGDSRYDAAKSPQWLAIPAGLLRADADNRLSVIVRVQAGRWGGLAAPVFGPERDVYPIYQDRYMWRQFGAAAIVFSMALMAILAGGLWWLQRDAVYGYFAWAAVCGVLRSADRLWEQPPLPWPLWGGVVAAALAAHAVLLAQFSLALIGVDGPRWRLAFRTVLAAEVTMAMVGLVGGWPMVWTAALALLAPVGLLALGWVVHRAVTRREREAVAVSVAGAVVCVMGVRDFLVVRVGTDGLERFSLLPHATMMFVLLMGWVVADRYARQTRAYRQLMDSLDHQVRERGQQLEASYVQLQHETAERAKLQERQRIMRDIHDGVGAQLVGLLSLISKGRTEQTVLQEHARAALDELRMAVDAMQPVNGDLATVLATLRYRLQPRFSAAGIDVDWQVDELPPTDSLTPQVVLQIQRILLEAFTNVLRHANATRIRVAAHAQDLQAPTLVMEIVDNGVGLNGDHPPAHGQGLRNMHARAVSIGARLEMTGLPGQGTQVQLTLPVQ